MPKTVSHILLYALTRDVLAQVEGNDCATRLLVINHLKEELADKYPDKITIIKVARILAAEDNGYRVLDRFTIEVPGWEKAYPLAINGKVKWKKWFHIPVEVLSR